MEMEPEIEKQVIDFISTETERIQYGKLFIEVTVLKGRATNIQGETKRSLNLNRPNEAEQ
jgi:hypothetical protein